MSEEIKVNNTTLRLIKGDITDLEIDAFVFYAQHNLKLGSGFGNAISMRGGPSVQEELDKYNPIETTEVTTTAAGGMKAKYIIHAVGPRFQEPDLEKKLETTMINCLREADSKGIQQVAFPPMGAGFYGIPLPVCADIMIDQINNYLQNDTKIKDVVISLLDKRDFVPFEKKLQSLKQTKKEVA